MILGEKDSIVDNASTRAWFDQTATTKDQKEMKLMAGAYHELSKELKRVDFVERLLQFGSKVCPAGCKGFGADYDPKKVVIKQTGD